MTSQDLSLLPLLGKVCLHAEGLMRRGEFAEMRAWCEAAPPDLRKLHPELNMWLAWALVAGDAPAQAEACVRAAESRLAQLQQTAARNPFDRHLLMRLNFASVRAQLALIRAIAARRARRFDEAAAHLAIAGRYLSGADPVLAAVLAMEQAAIARRQADPVAEQRHLTGAARRAAAGKHPLLQVIALSGLSALSLQHDDLPRAGALAGQAHAIAQRHNPAMNALIHAQVAGLAQLAPLASLGPREREVLDCLARGWRDVEIAGALEIAASTVRWHCRNIYRKLGVANRSQAVAALLASGQEA